MPSPSLAEHRLYQPYIWLQSTVPCRSKANWFSRSMRPPLRCQASLPASGDPVSFFPCPAAVIFDGFQLESQGPIFRSLCPLYSHMLSQCPGAPEAKGHTEQKYHSPPTCGQLCACLWLAVERAGESGQEKRILTDSHTIFCLSLTL